MSNPIRKLQKFTGRICATMCEVPDKEKKHRCCDALFCSLTQKHFPPGVEYKPTGHAIPFMGPKGCIVKPEHRVFCTAFLCHGIATKSPVTWKKYLKLCDAAGLPPNNRGGAEMPCTQTE